jgi:hypothetical protein
VYLCYIDESGTSQVPGNSSHFVLAGLSIPIWRWKDCEHDIQAIKQRYSLEDTEIHTAWLLRDYREQRSIPNFSSLGYSQRRTEVTRFRNAKILHLQKHASSKAYNQVKKNFRQTDPYIHLTRKERRDFIRSVARCVGGWGFARLFAECLDKIYFDPTKHHYTVVDEVAFDQLVSRFEQFLRIAASELRNFGLLIHDNNQTIAKKHTELMQSFYRQGTLWTKIDHIIETPLFVDSSLTGMVQIADLCAYALRRYLENDEADLFESIFQRADRRDEVVVGVRHFTKQPCSCKICEAHIRR